MLTRKKIKEEIKDEIAGVTSFDSMIHKISIYIFDNYQRRKKKIDSEAILKKKRKKKK